MSQQIKNKKSETSNEIPYLTPDKQLIKNKSMVKIKAVVLNIFSSSVCIITTSTIGGIVGGVVFSPLSALAGVGIGIATGVLFSGVISAVALSIFLPKALKNVDKQHLIKILKRSEQVTFRDFITEFEEDILPYYQIHEENFDEIMVHGRLHASRVVLFAEIMANYLIEKKGIKVNLQLLRRIAGLHDSGREGNGIDLWEENTAHIIKKYLIKKGYPKDFAKKQSKMVIKRSKGNSIERVIFSSADCIDIMRPCTDRGGYDGFDEKRLKFLSNATEGSNDYLFRKQLINEAWKFIQVTEELKYSMCKQVFLNTNFNFMNYLLGIIHENQSEYKILSTLLK